MPRASRLLDKLFPGRIRKFAAPAVLLLLNLYFYTNAKALFGPVYAAAWSDVFLFYVLMALAAAAISPFLFQKPASAPILWQILAFVGLSAGVFVGVGLIGYIPIGAPPSPGTSGGLASLFPVAALEITTGGTEEILFRGALGEKTGPVISSLAFGAWHLAAYGADPFQIAIAVVMGFVFWFIWDSTKDRWGNAINGAVHVGLNLARLVPLMGLI